MDAGIVTLDAEGSITGWSKGAERLLGWSREEMIGKKLIEIFPAEAGAADLLAAELASAGSSQGPERRCRSG
jgi:PAS domain S-box-containing protein